MAKAFGKRVLFIFFAFLLTTLAATFAGESLVYYADQPSPPRTLREPPYPHTRMQVQKEFYYWNIRYPYQRPGKNGLSMKFSLGNETAKIIFFQVLALEITRGKETMKLIPFYFDQDAGEKRSGMEALKKYRHRMIPNLHREVEIEILEFHEESPENLNLRIDIAVTREDKTDILHQQITLYPGFYTL